MELPPLLTLRSAARLSLTDDQLLGPRFRRLHRGVYAPADRDLTLTERAAGTLLIMPRDGVITGVTALHLHGVEIGVPEPIRVATATAGQSRRPGVRLSRMVRIPEAAGRLVRPVPAWLSACAELNLIQAVAAADWLIRLGRTTQAQLLDAAAHWTARGCRLARRAAGLARKEVDSPKETELRLLLVLAGLPEPRCNPRIGTDHEPIGRMDLVLDPYRIIAEYDGEQHRTDPRQWARDIARHEAAVNAGYLIIRVTAGRLLHPKEIAETTYARLRERGYPGPPPNYSAEWLTLFGTSHRL
ncbi:hypothetical protein [Microlunatus speluncae]|uniref:hypothetical protein n=1 Tax=Microlunatus speluncae TaxID=2594267 RepID=UPI0012660B67|nr:hypothetical protein [Microlunatus speluncae]